MLDEFLLWVHLSNLSVASQVLEKNVSDIIFILYVISYILNKKSCFIVAFLLCEIAGVTYNSTPEYGYKLFLVYSVIYAILLIKLKHDNYNNETLFYCGIMLLFEGVMTIDTFIFYEIETMLYNLYVPIVFIIHLFIIFTLFKRRYNWHSLGVFISTVLTKYRITYNSVFFWYNNKN